jgi:hypothetical protein
MAKCFDQPDPVLPAAVSHESTGIRGRTGAIPIESRTGESHHRFSNGVPRRIDTVDYNGQDHRLQETFPASDPVGRYWRL